MPAVRHVSRFLPVAVILALTACDEPAPTLTEPDGPAAAVTSTCFGSNRKVEALMECVTLGGVRSHQAVLQAIADARGGNRTTATAGHNASAQYVADQLIAAGYQVTLQPFQITAFIQLGPSALEVISPPPAGPFAEGSQYDLLSYTPAGDVTAAVSAVSSLGCNASDYAGFPVGNIALVPRGTCTFALKAVNAEAAGAAGVIIYNNISGLINGTLSSSFVGTVPVMGTTMTVGQQLASTPGLIVRMKADVTSGTFTTHNVLAESSQGDPGNVVIVGGHLDSVNRGPGINDNGSGTAAILETALQMAGTKTRNRVRFAFWSGEELGLIGSTHYVSSLSQAELDAIALYLNFDMIGSPNYVRFVLDGDGSDSPFPGVPASAAIESFFRGFYADRGLASEIQILSGRSDYQPFSNAGIPVGGVATGSDGIKTAAEVAIYGGTAGSQYDPCYHLACDTYANVSLDVLDLNADAVAAATLTFAMNTEAVNGVKGKGRFKTESRAVPNSVQAVK